MIYDRGVIPSLTAHAGSKSFRSHSHKYQLKKNRMDTDSA